MRESFARYVSKQRLRPWHLALCVLLVGWLPSLLLAFFSYRVLGRTLENKIMDDAQELVASLGQHVENELQHTGETVDYYRTYPTTVALLQPLPPIAPAVTELKPSSPPATSPSPTPNSRHNRPPTPGTLLAPTASTPAALVAIPTGTPTPQEWLAGVYYPRVKRIDGMFLADATGHVVASLPASVHELGSAELSEVVRHTAERAAGAETSPGGPDDTGYRVTPVYPRAADGRLVVSVVSAVKDKSGATLLGYLGADILVERLGRRLNAIEHTTGANTHLQIIDANGRGLFTPGLAPNALESPPIDSERLRAYRHNQHGVQEVNGTLHIFTVVQPTGWIAVMERPANLLLRPVHDLLRRTLFLVGWLVIGTFVAAFLLSTFYRRQLMSSLRTEREQIFNEKILANMPVGISLIDPAGEHLLQANRTFIDIIRSLGHLPREAEVSKATFAELALATREALARVLHFGVPYQAIEQRIPTAKGGARFLTTNLLRLQDNQARTIGVLCLVEDATAAVTLRQELINANTAKDQFLAQLSHELRNPLSPVITMVSELETYGEALPAMREPLEIIRRNVELEARLIDDLLDVTRISSGKLQLATQTVDVHRTIGLALEICQREIDDKGLRLELELRARDQCSNADPARLQQVFWNLIKNAVKFTPEGRRIMIRSHNFAASSPTGAPMGNATTHVLFARPLEKAGASTNGLTPAANATPGPVTYLRVEVSDEGIGIEPQHLMRIFNAFDQGQASTTQRFGGLGLGLAISKAMVEAHGGTLSVASEGTGKGANFIVDLATCPAPAAEPEASPVAVARTVAPAGKGRRILLVDDHEDTCFGMQRLLNRRGYDVVVAHSVADGLAKSRTEARFDLLISDLGLPDGSGCELMSAVKADGGPPGIALSGYGMEGDIDKTREAGFSDHLIKPVAIDRLEAAMRRLLV